MSLVIDFFNNNNINYFQATETDIKISCFNKKDHKNGDQNPSLYINIEKGYFHCWSCHISGNFAQLIASLGFIDQINFYLKGYDKSKLKYDIETLKNQGSDVINIPGIGKFYKIKTEENKEISSILSRKVNITEEIDKLSKLILNGGGTLEDRKRLIYLIEEGRLGTFKIPEKFQRVNYLEYLSERGLPQNFCQKYEVYINKENSKYFALPIKNFKGDIINLLNISFSKETTPRMYSEVKLTNPILGFDKIDYNKNIYIVEGWLDYLKLMVSGYNAFPTLSNHFNQFHYSIVQQCSGKKFFIFDNDVPGVSMLEDVLNYISRSDTDWYGIFLNPHLYKDVGDIELLQIPYELNNSPIEPLLTFKKYKILLGIEKYNANKKIIHSDGYTFRGDPVFTDIRPYSGKRNEKNIKSNFDTGGKSSREMQLGYPW
jgi:hypothetical protein